MLIFCTGLSALGSEKISITELHENIEILQTTTQNVEKKEGAKFTR